MAAARQHARLAAVAAVALGAAAELVTAVREAGNHAPGALGATALLVPIVCVGETKAEREAGKAVAVVRKQLRGSVPEGATAATLVVAYEPVWAIGTGLTPTAADVAEMHEAIRGELGRMLGKAAAAGVRLLYGGSVKPSNAAELMNVAHVDGALVGGASLKAEDFLAIARACA